MTRPNPQRLTRPVQSLCKKWESDLCGILGDLCAQKYLDHAKNGDKFDLSVRCSAFFYVLFLYHRRCVFSGVFYVSVHAYHMGISCFVI